GYPNRLKAEDLPLQARILAVADVFEALTARDRPYKQPMKLSQALKILGFMKKDKHIDPDVFDLFVNTGLHRRYAESELNPDQIDEA
ncbi:MAG TPA: metal-dependent phosphohydrolase, partial [Desulfovibrio sp.]|nr:metal-dependent phosphohydrolase [Desulfovibrio sp.]